MSYIHTMRFVSPLLSNRCLFWCALCIIQVLIYCWTVLRLLPVAEVNTQRATLEGTGSEDNARDANRFSAFDVEGEEDDDEEEDIGLFPTSTPRPEPVENGLTVEDLLHSDDRHDAVLFLLTLDELMGLVVGQHRVLVQNVAKHKRRGVLDMAMMEYLLDGSIAASFAIQSVRQLETELQASHAHLNTPCRLLAALALPELTAEVDSIVRQHGSKSCERGDIISFLGDCMQCCFHNPSDSWSRRDTVVDEFVTQYEVDSTGSGELERLFKGLQHTTLLEITMKTDVGVEQLRQAVTRTTGQPHKSHSWLARMEYISGDRAIHHTLRVLQLFGGVIDGCPTDRTLVMDPRRRGMFGNPDWTPGCSPRIRDMDELLMARLLPSWANMCRHGIMSKVKLPRDDELCPFFVELKCYVDHPREPVTWGLAFGVHAALSGILDAGRALPDVVATSKFVFENYFAQAANCAKLSLTEKSSHMGKSPAWTHNLTMVSFLENFGLPAYDELALWNPLSGGSTFAMLDFLGNIDGGCAMIDCQAQLRIVMYLYHGLLINDIIKEEEIPLLHILYNGFKQCKAVWQGSLPKRGELAKRFWIGFGMGLPDSKKMSEDARLLAQGGRRSSSGDLFAQGVKLCRGRKMHPIEPAEMLTSFRRVCERDFSDVVDKYHTPEQKKNAKGTEQYTVACRINDTLDHLENEIQLHAVNFIPAAYYLEQFVCSISRVLGWEPLLKAFKLESNADMRQGVAIIFAQHLLGALDFAADPLNHTFPNVPGLVAMAPAPNIIAGTASFLVEFFNKVPAQNVMWFQALDSGDGTNVKVVR